MWRHFLAWVCTFCISVAFQRIQFSSCTSEDQTKKLCSGGLFFVFSRKKKARTLKKCEISHIELNYLYFYTVHTLVTSQRIQFSWTWKNILKLCNEGLVFVLSRKSKRKNPKHWKHSFTYIFSPPPPLQRGTGDYCIRSCPCVDSWVWICTACISVTLQWIPFSSCTWKEYILELCNEGLILIFLKNWKEREIWEKMWNFLYRLAIFMNLYGLYLCNQSTDSLLRLHMERTYIKVVQRGRGGGLILIFLENWKKSELFEIMWNFLYKLTIFHEFYTAHILGSSHWIPFTCCIWKDQILELCNGGLFCVFLESWKIAKT